MPIRTPTCSACAWHSFRPSTHHLHSSSGEPIGTTLPTVDGTTVRIFPPSSLIMSIVSLTYWTLPTRTYLSSWRRSRPPTINVTEPQHSSPFSSSSERTSLVSYSAGSPEISIPS